MVHNILNLFLLPINPLFSMFCFIIHFIENITFIVFSHKISDIKKNYGKYNESEKKYIYGCNSFTKINLQYINVLSCRIFSEYFFQSQIFLQIMVIKSYLLFNKILGQFWFSVCNKVF